MATPYTHLSFLLVLTATGDTPVVYFKRLEAAPRLGVGLEFQRSLLTQASRARRLKVKTM